MDFEEPTEKALSDHTEELFRKKHNFPWIELPVGKSFFVKPDQIANCQTLRTMASREGKKLGRKFRVIDHGERFEVYCAAEQPAGPEVPPRLVKKSRIEEPSAEAKKVDPGEPVGILPSDSLHPDTGELMRKHYNFTCYSCNETNDGVGMMFPQFEANDTQVRMRCLTCGEYNVLDRPTTPKFFKD